MNCLSSPLDLNPRLCFSVKSVLKAFRIAEEDCCANEWSLMESGPTASGFYAWLMGTTLCEL